MNDTKKRLLPSKRQKKRYLAFQIVSNSKIKDYKAVSNEIIAKTKELIGTLGLKKADIRIIKDCFKPEIQRGIIKISHKSVDEIKLALSSIEKINNKKAIIKTVGVSGILKKAKQRYLK
ncbi:hypothetical protein KY332_00105 [Candidatus Woesearchaeota archaeon]|nr:hypothetical protein [Candidatus Woesearchaeota archaeon]